MITIDAIARDVKVNPKMIRKEGKIPAVFYGRGQESTPIAVEKAAFKKAYETAGESTIISLKTPKGALDALIHDVELDPVLGVPIHIDFYIVAKDRKIEVDVPIEFIGVAPAEKEGGIVMKVMHEVRISALPADLPPHITVDLSKLVDMESQITVGDLALGDGVEPMVPETELVVGMTMPHEEKEEVPTPIDLTQIEVSEKKGKEDDEEAGESAEAEAKE